MALEIYASQANDTRTLEVKADAQRLWAKLLSLYEGQAHIALGYNSWAEYCQQEFRIGNRQAYRLLQAAQVVNQLSSECPMGHSLQVTSQVPESERLARELVPLLNNPQALDEAWNEAVEAAGGVPTAQAGREVVSNRRVSRRICPRNVRSSPGNPGLLEQLSHMPSYT
jgi:hypothetical protein